MLLGTLTAAAGVYLGTQMEDDTHAENLIDTVGEALLDDDDDNDKDDERRNNS